MIAAGSRGMVNGNMPRVSTADLCRWIKVRRARRETRRKQRSQ